MIECTDELVKSVTPMFHKVIKDTMSYFNNSDVEYDTDDLLQECVIYTMEACRKYNPNRNCKFTTFLYRLLYCRMGSHRNSINNKKFKYGVTVNFTSIMFKEAGDSEQESFDEFYRADTDSVENHLETLVHKKMEAEKIFSLVRKKHRKEIYQKFFIEGKNITEIVDDFDNKVSSIKIRKEVKFLTKIHNTLVEGSLCPN